MHLQRIQVPDFRALKDVDITFEKEFVPSIFPLGSLNGGGKSTLLQLIFVLLHCSTDPNKIGFLKNMLYGFNISKDSNKKVLAIFDIWDGVKTINLEFFSCNDFYIKNLMTQNGKEDKETYNDYLRFSILENIEAMKNIILPQEKEIHEIEGSLTRLNSIKGVKFSEEINLLLTEVVERFQSLGRDVEDLTISPIILEEAIDNYFIEGIQEGVKELQTILALTKKIVQFLKEEFYEKAEIAAQKVSQYLESEKIIYICNFLGNESPEEVLLCQINNEDINQAEAELFLKELSQKVFLAAPATQVFLFLPKESIKSLFRDMRSYENNKSYYSELQVAKSKLPGFFAYDFLDVELLIESFKSARDRDFIKAIETGEYGNHYKELLKELDLILVNKKINLNPDISGVSFKLDTEGETIELQPEDLSHGELKRLSIYMWIKYRNIENAIVFMDEIEIAFHPDWQYQIIADLQQWAPSNHYILATHSYELCQALTPSHVKELEPKLLNQEAQQ